MFSLKNKSAIVTGGGSGIGKAIVEIFAKQGATVHIMELDESNAAQVAKDIETNGGKATAHSCDVSNQQKVKEVFNGIGDINILVNCAGIANVGKADTTSEEDFINVFNVNVKGTYNCLHEVLPVFKSLGRGVILNIASIAAWVGITDRFAYSMSKGAVFAMTLSVARDYLADNIRCNSISPARVHTAFVDGFIEKNYPGKEEEMFEKLSKSQPIGRMGTVEEVAALALYLSCPEIALQQSNQDD